MRSFQHVVVFLFALVACAFAQSYDATVYITSTVYKVNTVTLSGTPTASVGNSTSTVSALATPVYSVPGNGTGINPTGSGAPAVPTPSAFPGAASGLNVNGALVAALAAGLGYLVL